MDKEIKNLIKGLREDPKEFADKLVDDMYKSKLPDNVYQWHSKMRSGHTWDEYIINVLIADYQHEFFG